MPFNLKCCRICRKTDELCTFFGVTYVTTSDQVLMENIISDVLGVEVHETDKLPHFMCKSCLKIILESFEIKQKAAEAYIFFERANRANQLPTPNVVKSEPVNVKREFSTRQRNSLPNMNSSRPLNASREDSKVQLMTFETPELVEMQPREKSNSSAYTCDLCGRSQKTKNAYENHMLAHSNTFQCDICGSNLGSSYSLRRHQETHKKQKALANKKKKSFSLSCDQCKATFQFQEALDAHIKIQHPRPQGEEFPQQMEQEEYPFVEETETAPPSPEPVQLIRVPPQMLHTILTEPRSTPEYVRQTSTETPAFMCRVCLEPFRSAGVLQQHLNRYVTYNPVKCNVCNKWFHTSYLLAGHRREHDQILCNQCPEKRFFSTANQLDAHIKAVHNRAIEPEY